MPTNYGDIVLTTDTLAENFSALTRLDHNRAVAQVAIKAGVPIEKVTGSIIWGNHSSTQYPDINSCTVDGASRILQLIKFKTCLDDQDSCACPWSLVL